MLPKGLRNAHDSVLSQVQCRSELLHEVRGPVRELRHMWWAQGFGVPSADFFGPGFGGNHMTDGLSDHWLGAHANELRPIPTSGLMGPDCLTPLGAVQEWGSTCLLRHGVGNQASRHPSSSWACLKMGEPREKLSPLCFPLKNRPKGNPF